MSTLEGGSRVGSILSQKCWTRLERFAKVRRFTSLSVTKKKSFITLTEGKNRSARQNLVSHQGPGVVFTTLHLLFDLQMGPIN
jgi:hypothetical protein